MAKQTTLLFDNGHLEELAAVRMQFSASPIDASAFDLR